MFLDFESYEKILECTDDEALGELAIHLASKGERPNDPQLLLFPTDESGEF